jgi:hypothetical protein
MRRALAALAVALVSVAACGGRILGVDDGAPDGAVWCPQGCAPDNYATKPCPPTQHECGCIGPAGTDLENRCYFLEGITPPPDAIFCCK